MYARTYDHVDSFFRIGVVVGEWWSGVSGKNK